MCNCLQIEYGTGDVQHLSVVNSEASIKDQDDNIPDGELSFIFKMRFKCDR